MSCTSCKSKNNDNSYVNAIKTAEKSSRLIFWVIIGWSGFAIYGIYSLISKFL